MNGKDGGDVEVYGGNVEGNFEYGDIDELWIRAKEQTNQKIKFLFFSF